MLARLGERDHRKKTWRVVKKPRRQNWHRGVNLERKGTTAKSK